jgi:hypothetical protein
MTGIHFLRKSRLRQELSQEDVWSATRYFSSIQNGKTTGCVGVVGKSHPRDEWLQVKPIKHSPTNPFRLPIPTWRFSNITSSKISRLTLNHQFAGFKSLHRHQSLSTVSIAYSFETLKNTVTRLLPAIFECLLKGCTNWAQLLNLY